jgi:di/tricarboxylate transporter
MLRFEAEDILILEGEEAALRPLIAADGLVQLGAEPVDPELIRSPDVRVIEVVIMPGSLLTGASMRALRLHQRYGINLLAVARQGRPAMIRLGSIRFRVGDLLLLHGSETTFAAVLPALRCLPLEAQGPVQPLAARAWVPIAIFTGAVALVATGIAPAPLAFLTGAIALVLSSSVSVRDVYQNIEWPVVVLLGALIPLGHALETTGVTSHISASLIGSGSEVPIAMILGGIVVASMLLSDLIHNSPTAVLMAPVGLGIANELSLGPDAFLMAVAIGAASPYLTPIGHPSNTLVLGPGDYRFGDYWRLGLPLDLIIVLASVPLIMFVWL